jgi:hypothetical protein
MDPAVFAIMKREDALKATSSSDSAHWWYHNARASVVSQCPSFRGITMSELPWYQDARASVVLRAMNDAWRNQDGDDVAKDVQDLDNTTDRFPVAQLRRQFKMSINQIEKQDSGDKAEEHAKIVAFVTDAIRVTVASMLFIDPSAVIFSRTVADHGIDSLLAAKFRNWFHGAFGQNINMLDLMDAMMKINLLAQKIVDEAAT